MYLTGVHSPAGKNITAMKTAYRCLRTFVVCLLVAGAALVRAQLPRQISYQGFIADPNGIPIADGIHTIEIRLYEVPANGQPLYSEAHQARLSGGVFGFVLGSITPFPAALAFDRQYWLGVSVDGEPEMQPRTALIAVPYAVHSEAADVAKSLAPDAQGVVTSVNEIDGAVRITGDGSIKVNKNGSAIELSANIPETGVSFDRVTSGLNRGEDLEVGSGSALKPVGGGVVTANSLSGSATLDRSVEPGAFAGKVKIPRGATSVAVNLAQDVGCTPASSVTVSQMDPAGSEILVGTMVTDIADNSFKVEFSASYPTDSGYLSYLVVNP